ncbi:MAG: gliding motility protein GldM [Bacteroidetes bacterium]|nr:gliding motility protein GldM [Bacteroidota bacterium]
MAGGKETPRQKMIGMMYLVLTALLAMNVSKDILNAFVTINESLVKTNANFDAKNDVTSNAFEIALLNDERKTKQFYNAAKSIRSKAKDIDKFIIELKSELFQHVDKLEKATADTIQLARFGSKDNYDAPTHYLIGDNPEKATGKAVELKEKITNFRKDILGLIKASVKKPGAAASFEQGLGLKTDRVYSLFEEMEVSWENNLFYHVPLAAVIAHLSRIQNEVKNCEGDAINMLYSEISASDFKFDTLAAKVVAPTSYVLTGNEYTADIFVAAFSTTQNPQIWLGEVDSVTNKIKGPVDSSTVKVSRGIGTYTIKTGGEGLQKYSGLIRVKSPDNSYKSYPFTSSYMVARPAASVSPDKMNVFYIGVDNPVTITAAGVAPSDLSPSITGGSLTKASGPGQYVVRVSGGTLATVNVGAKISGNNQNMGSFKFRVKRVPDPVAYFAGKKGDDKIGKGELLVTQGVMAKLENFDFDLKFDIKSFDITMSAGGGIATASSNSNRITSEQANLLKNAKTGTRVFIENVRAMGPDGVMRKIPGVNLKVGQ